MDEYIKRTEALGAICDACINYGDASNCASCLMIKNVRDTIPAADVVSVVHARWIEGSHNGIRTLTCSSCQSEYAEPYDLTVDEFPNYCSDCGAKMDGKKPKEEGIDNEKQLS